MFIAVATPSIAPPIPEISYGEITDGGTQITATITNYSSYYSYAVTSDIGSVSVVGDAITVTGLTSGQSVNLIVIATSPRGLSTPSSAVTDRQPYTYRTETRTGTRLIDTTSCYIAGPGGTCPYGGELNNAGTECCVVQSYYEDYTYTVQILNAGPAGYLDSGYDWYKVSNVSIERIPYTYYTETYTYTYSCTVSYPCTVPCTVPGTCEYPTTCCSTGTCVGSATWYQENQVCYGCPAGWYCPAGMTQDGTLCYYTCTICNPCTGYEPCQVPSTCPSTCSGPGTCTGTGTRQVRNATPEGYLDSGVDWYRFV